MTERREDAVPISAQANACFIEFEILGIHFTFENERPINNLVKFKIERGY